MAKVSAPHFKPEALAFLRALARNNRRDWFATRKDTFDEVLKAPLLDIIDSVNTAMLSFAPAYVAAPKKVIRKLHRDTRFTHDKSPFKKHVAAWWSPPGFPKTSGGGFYFHASPKELVIAAGVYKPEREQLLAIRMYLLDHHDELRRLLESRKLRQLLDEFEGSPLTRAPKGFPKDHPGINFLLCRQWGVSATLPAEGALAPTLVHEIVTRFRAAAPIVDLLNRPLLARLAAQKKSFF